MRAAITYWAAIFALGFVLGAVRVSWGAAALGETCFMLGEVALLLVASAWVARVLTRRHRIVSVMATLTMGCVSFVLLIAAELALATSLGGLVANEWFVRLWQTPRLFGTMGQVAFGLMPLVARPRARQT